MGNRLPLLLLGPDFEREQLFPALLDAGCTVRDLVRLGLTCTEAHAFVVTTASTLTRPRLRQLLLSLPPGGYAPFVRYEKSCALLKRGSVVWDLYEVLPGKVMVRLLRLESEAEPQPPNRRLGWSDYRNYANVLHAAWNFADTEASGRYSPEFPMFFDIHLQWYPLLDRPLRACVARFRAEEARNAVADDEAVMEPMGSHMSLVLLGTDFERAQLFPTLLDAGCTVRDLVRLGLTCTEARSFVTANASALSRPRLTQLLLSVPAGSRKQFWTHGESCRLLAKGHLIWVHGEMSCGDLAVDLARLDTAGAQLDRSGARPRDFTVLEPARDGTIFFALLPFYFQWYPLLDDALRSCVARLRTSEDMANKAASAASVTDDDDEDEPVRKRLCLSF